MRSLVPKLLIVAIVAVASLACVPAASAAPTYGGSFKVSATEANNAKIISGPDGNVWTTLPGSTKDVAKITPAGLVTEFDLPGITVIGGIAASPEGKLWVVVNGGVARFSPENPAGAEEFPVSAGIKPNASIVAGPEGRMWVATEGLLVSFPPAEVATVKSEFGITGMNPHDIDVAGSQLVIADAAKGRIVTFAPGVLPKTGEVKFVRNPTGTSQGVAGNPDGQVAFSESDGEEGLALASPPAPAASILLKVGDPFGVALGPDGAYYFAMAGDDDVRRLTANGEVSTIAGFPPNFFPRQITGGPAHTVWVMMEIPGGNTVEVARISGVELPPVVTPPPTGPPPPAPPVPQTKLGKGPKGTVHVRSGKATVKFTFSSTVAGSTFQCSLVKVPTGKKRKRVPKATFSSCRSPKVLHLGPGKYRFAVRALAAGVTDPTPVKRTFSVKRVPSHR
jgi:virginiamycin B lyase